MTAEAQLERFIEKFDPERQQLLRAVRKKLRKRFPSATELVYDNYNFFVIGYSPTERPSDAILSTTGASTASASATFRGRDCPTRKLLMGSGNQTRFIRLDSAAVLDRPDVEALIAAAVSHAKTPLQAGGRGQLVFRSVSARQRPRRRA